MLSRKSVTPLIEMHRGSHRGDQLIRVIIETPRKLTSRQRDLLEEFARNGGEEVSPLSKGFFDKVKEMFG